MLNESKANHPMPGKPATELKALSPKPAKVRHAETCAMAFGRKDPTCPRCIELLSGAKPVVWSSARKDSDAMRIRDIRDHSCAVNKCGPVCTFGDW